MSTKYKKIDFADLNVKVGILYSLILIVLILLVIAFKI